MAQTTATELLAWLESEGHSAELATNYDGVIVKEVDATILHNTDLPGEWGIQGVGEWVHIDRR